MKRDYKKSLADGKFAENLLRRLLDNAGLPNGSNPTKDSSGLLAYDVQALLGERRVTFEVKYDKMASKTGNVAVEYRNTKKNKPSGILATRADFWVFVFAGPVEVHVASVAALLEYFHSDARFRDITCGGDDNSAMKLYRRDQILPAVFRRLDAAPPESVPAVLSGLLTGPTI